MPFTPGDHVHIAMLGKGIVREVRNRGRYVVELKGGTVIVTESQLTVVEQSKRKRTKAAAAAPVAGSPDPVAQTSAPRSLDLHGMTAQDAIDVLDAFLNAAMFASLDEVRIIHGRSGGRLKDAVHARLGQLRSVRAFRIDPRNAGVTIVML